MSGARWTEGEMEAALAHLEDLGISPYELALYAQLKDRRADLKVEIAEDPESASLTLEDYLAADCDAACDESREFVRSEFENLEELRAKLGW